MDSFLARFLDEVTDWLGDPSTAKRYTNSKRLRDLQAVQATLFNRLMNGAGELSELGRTEITITLEEDVDHYPLPALFQQFIAFEKRTDGDPLLVEAYLPSLDTYAPGPGVRILRDAGSLQVVPRPPENWAGDWTLVFRRRPAILHRATAANFDADSFDCATPATDAGELVKVPNYYAGVPFRVYSATVHAPQVNVCTSSAVSNPGGVVTLNFANRDWSPLPTGTILYEVVPELPTDLDSIYAMDCAIKECTRRRSFPLRATLMREREELWRAVRAYFTSAAADRPPQRSQPPRPYHDDPYD